MSETNKITSKSQVNDLPDDAKILKEMVLTLLEQIDDLSGQLYYLKRQLFGKKSEKLNSAQRLLFEDLYEQVQTKIEQKQTQKPSKKKKRRNPNHKGRNALPEDLPREEVIIEPENKTCNVCKKEKSRIGEEITEKLDYHPASFFVKKIVRPKYCCQSCQGKFAIAQLPAMAIDKGIAAEGLLAHIITSKYCDHAPLNRLEGILKRHGVTINVSSMSDWVGKCSSLLEPLTKRMREIILTSPKIHTDDTGIPFKSKKRKGSIAKGYLWAYIDNAKNVVFDFTTSRSREGPLKFLDNYSGYLQADAYAGYDELFRTTGATEVGCHAHARRKFDYALDNDPVRAARMLVFWKDLYAIEKTAKAEKYSPEKLLQARQEKAKPILAEMELTLAKYKKQTLPQSPIGKAITYCLNQWSALQQYIYDPILAIDNNLSERTLRMIAIGRKNWMFAGSEIGAQRAAIIYSLVASCKLNNIDPFAYFRDILQRVSTHPANRIDDLLPTNWHPPQN